MTLLRDLARARAAFQQHTLHMILTERPMTQRHPLDGNAITADAHYDRPEPVGTHRAECHAHDD